MKASKEQLQSWARRIHANATAHGWHEEEKPGYHWLGMVMTEVAEAIEADRKGRRFSEEAKEKYLAVTTDSEGYHVTVAIMKMAYEDFIKGTVEVCRHLHSHSRCCIRASWRKHELVWWRLSALHSHFYRNGICACEENPEYRHDESY